MQQGTPQGSIVSFLWTAAGMGALSLLTPCVFPMIPITVSYFTKRPSQSRGEAIRIALIYSLGIILTFTAAGFGLAALFGASGVNRLVANPWINLLITAVFLGFALSLLGAYFISMPSGIVTKLDRSSRGSDVGQISGTLLMALTFTLTSFTCIAPFVGTLLVMATQGRWTWPLLGMLVYATIFSVPFFVLAVVPQMLTQLPKSGSWLNSVKVVMGFIEIAAAMKFLSNADLVWHWQIFTRTVVLSIWVAIGLLIVLYLLGKFRLSHDTEMASVSSVRVLFAIFFLAGAVWLTTGLLGHPLGELEPFLPPVEAGATTAPSAQPQELTWILNDFPAAMQQAKSSNKPMLIDFTGYTCTNCRWMEANMFPRPEIKSQLQKFVLARLFTDREGEPYEGQQKMEKDRFDTVALPLYAIVGADGRTIAVFPGLTRDPKEFLQFLQK